jgi:salicylate 5-hydroxylase small subunit
MTAATPSLTPEDFLAIVQLYAEQDACLDRRELERWPELFTDDARYTLQSRENADRGLPLAIMAFESRGMLLDRVYGARETLFHHPYSQRHLTGLPRVLAADAQGFEVETAVLVVRTPRDALPEVLVVGGSRDRLVRTPEGLRFAVRHVVYDNDLLPNSIIDPV